MKDGSILYHRSAWSHILLNLPSSVRNFYNFLLTRTCSQLQVSSSLLEATSRHVQTEEIRLHNGGDDNYNEEVITHNETRVSKWVLLNDVTSAWNSLLSSILLGFFYTQLDPSSSAKRNPPTKKKKIWKRKMKIVSLLVLVFDILCGVITW